MEGLINKELTEKIDRKKCVHCKKSAYYYVDIPNSIFTGKVLCQECGMLFLKEKIVDRLEGKNLFD